MTPSVSTNVTLVGSRLQLPRVRSKYGVEVSSDIVTYNIRHLKQEFRKLLRIDGNTTSTRSNDRQPGSPPSTPLPRSYPEIPTSLSRRQHWVPSYVRSRPTRKFHRGMKNPEPSNTLGHTRWRRRY